MPNPLSTRGCGTFESKRCWIKSKSRIAHRSIYWNESHIAHRSIYSWSPSWIRPGIKPEARAASLDHSTETIPNTTNGCKIHVEAHLGPVLRASPLIRDRHKKSVSNDQTDTQTRMTSRCLLPPRLSATRDSQQREYRNICAGSAVSTSICIL